jgi:hypothetical protein
VIDKLPPCETPVLVLLNGDIRIGILEWDTPGFEDTYRAYKYWDDPHDDGQCWEWCDITHWMALPEAPQDWEDVQQQLCASMTTPPTELEGFFDASR